MTTHTLRPPQRGNLVRLGQKVGPVDEAGDGSDSERGEHDPAVLAVEDAGDAAGGGAGSRELVQYRRPAARER